MQSGWSFQYSEGQDGMMRAEQRAKPWASQTVGSSSCMQSGRYSSGFPGEATETPREEEPGHSGGRLEAGTPGLRPAW